MIHIVTPCSRPQNLEKIAPSIPQHCKWWIIYDNKVTNIPFINKANYLYCLETGKVGAEGRNFFIENININDNDWIYSLDDDNIIHPDFFNSVLELLDKEYSIIHWGQLKKDGSIRLKPKIGLNEIDAACFMTKWKFNKNLKYITDRYDYDGIYALDCSQNGPYFTIDKYLCYYNYLR